LSLLQSKISVANVLPIAYILSHQTALPLRYKTSYSKESQAKMHTLLTLGCLFLLIAIGVLLAALVRSRRTGQELSA
jgi:uncharacterized membrane protein affecting hemolysin expression